MFYQFLLISFINSIYGSFTTFEGTYKVIIAGEERQLNVCEDDNKVIFWGLTKVLTDTIGAESLNYVYAVGRDSSGMEKKRIKGKEHDIYEAECNSYWFKENELGTRTIQYYLRYNENKKYLKYTLSTAEFLDDPESIDNIYALEKVSEEVMGECFMSGDLTFEDVDYPFTMITDSPKIEGFGDKIINVNTDKNNVCFGFYKESTGKKKRGSGSFIDGGLAADGAANTVFEWENKLRISHGTWTNPCCQRFTSIVVSEFYDNDYNSYVVTIKCEGTNVGFILRYVETDRDFGECPLWEP